MRWLTALTLALVVLAAGPVSAQSPGVEQTRVHARADATPGLRALESSDRVFLLTDPAATQAPMTFRVGTADQLRTVQGSGSGFYADVFADFAPLAWLTVGGALAYGDVGETFGSRELAPTAYLKAQLLRQQDGAGADVAAQVRYKQVGFASGQGVGEPELEASLLAQRRLGRLALSMNAVLGGDVEAKEADTELRGAAGFSVLPNLVLGVDVLGRYNLKQKALMPGRGWELTGGPMGTLRLDQLTISILAGATAPMFTDGVGVAGMVQVGYSL